MSEETKFECWAIVELMGHMKIAGRVTEQTIAGAAMLRVDVPAFEAQPAFTRFFGASAIYSINPTTEEIARGMAGGCASEPVNRYQLPQLADAHAADEGEADDDDEEEAMP